MPNLEVLVTPRAATDRVGPVRDGVLLVRVTRPPADGDANRAVLKLVARALDVPPTHLSLVAGERARRKRIRVAGLGAGELAERLAGIGGD